MRRSVEVSRALGLMLGLALAGTSCGGKAESAAAAPATPAVVLLAPENVTKVQMGHITSGPMISGQLAPAREATVRSQVGGSIVELTVDRGQAVTAGQVLARISSRDLQESYTSVQAAVKSAETALRVAESEAQRTESLVKGGAVATRDLEQARNAVSTAEAQLAAAKSRERSVWQQLDDTTVKAPFAGTVTVRPASSGDVVAPGAELLTIIDPSSMRLEALVPADQVTQIKRGAEVRFKVRGVADPFVGRVERLNAAADPVTRQVAVFVSLPNAGGKLIAGLFAEGRVKTSSRDTIVVPLAAVDETGAVPFVTRIREGKAERVDVTLGTRQADTEQVEVTKGVAIGDVVVLGSARGVAAGTPVKITQ
ncbi:MAG: efflux RND transporter periplasmic adaptor subunit [Vicinamibacterales bacterium]